MSNEEKTKSAETAFVCYLIERINGKKGKKPDTGFSASLRRADNEATAYQSWEYLANWCDLENEYRRKPYALIAAALARAKPEKNGYLGIGQAISACYDFDKNSDPARSKLRRILACKNAVEACEVLRPVLNLLAAKSVKIDYARLLADLLYFNDEKRTRWAADFYGRPKEEENA
ncbi:MAG: type I-E CRISPR-associated protein Cse2/CasB [Spirochaetes bacterium GWF1_41_5]|nr:MAG: type I-E CRISPR-associated protein Cse2/CasB [Spirochaetes bacterium GWF1_41_5]HBE03175.1 type I-E CRISPR-associated protein Cse2/CasB [Spirochaetia bacterium]